MHVVLPAISQRILDGECLSVIVAQAKAIIVVVARIDVGVCSFGHVDGCSVVVVYTFDAAAEVVVGVAGVVV